MYAQQYLAGGAAAITIVKIPIIALQNAAISYNTLLLLVFSHTNTLLSIPIMQYNNMPAEVETQILQRNVMTQ